jgi:hypothetical protein
VWRCILPVLHRISALAVSTEQLEVWIGIQCAASALRRGMLSGNISFSPIGNYGTRTHGRSDCRRHLAARIASTQPI